jgi:hypothetical protein
VLGFRELAATAGFAAARGCGFAVFVPAFAILGPVRDTLGASLMLVVMRLVAGPARADRLARDSSPNRAGRPRPPSQNVPEDGVELVQRSGDEFGAPISIVPEA